MQNKCPTFFSAPVSKFLLNKHQFGRPTCPLCITWPPKESITIPVSVLSAMFPQTSILLVQTKNGIHALLVSFLSVFHWFSSLIVLQLSKMETGFHICEVCVLPWNHTLDLVILPVFTVPLNFSTSQASQVLQFLADFFASIFVLSYIIPLILYFVCSQKDHLRCIYKYCPNSVIIKVLSDPSNAWTYY